MGFLNQTPLKEAVLPCVTLHLLWVTKLNNIQPSQGSLGNTKMKARTGKAGTGNMFMASTVAGSDKSPQGSDFKHTKRFEKPTSI